MKSLPKVLMREREREEGGRSWITLENIIHGVTTMQAGCVEQPLRFLTEKKNRGATLLLLIRALTRANPNQQESKNCSGHGPWMKLASSAEREREREKDCLINYLVLGSSVMETDGRRATDERRKRRRRREARRRQSLSICLRAPAGRGV